MKFISPFARSLVLALVAFTGSANADSNMLAPAPGYTPAVKVSESHLEKIVVIADETDPTLQYPEVQSTDATKLCIKGSMAGLALADIGPGTSFSLDIGNLSVQFALGDDPGYTKGKTSVFIPAQGWDADKKPIGTDGLTLSWTAAELTIKVVNTADSSTDSSIFFPAFSPDFAGEVNPSIRRLGEVEISFGDLRGDTICYLEGVATTTTAHYGSGDYQEDFDLSNVKLSGSNDVTAPTVVVKAPTAAAARKMLSNANGDDPTLSISGTATDGHGIASVEVTATPDDPDSWQTADISSETERSDEDEWSPTTVAWSFELPEIGVGTTKLSVRATDLSGNLSATQVFTVVRDLPTPLQGRWDALITADGGSAPTGSLTFTVSPQGALSGKLTLLEQGKTYPFTGNWSGDTVHATIVRAGLPSLLLEAAAPSLDVWGVEDAWLDGSLTTTLSAADAARVRLAAPFKPIVIGVFGAFRSPYNATNRVPDELTGRFNMSTTSPDGTALGPSLLTLTTNKPGGAVIAGRLADGTVFTWTGRLGAGGQVPVYAALYGRKGVFAAQLQEDGYSVSADTGVWVRPPLFGSQFADGIVADSLSIYGERYEAPVAPDRVLWLADNDLNALITCTGDGIDGELSTAFTVSATNRATFDAPNDAGFRATIAASTGNVSGTFKLPDTVGFANFRGLIVGGEVMGFYVAPPATGTTDKRFGSVSIASNDQWTEPEPEDPDPVDDPGDDPIIGDPGGGCSGTPGGWFGNWVTINNGVPWAGGMVGNGGGDHPHRHHH